MKTFLLDELTPVALYSELKKVYPKEITMLFESVVNTSEGNFSFITIGAKERLRYNNDKSFFTTLDGTTEKLKESPFDFLQKYYQNIDKKIYAERAEKAGFSFTDGFIGYISYDMVKVFEPILKESMDSLKDTLNTPDLDLVRPNIIIGFSHKNSKLTVIDNSDTKNNTCIQTIENIIKNGHTHSPILKAQLTTGELSINEERFKALVEESKENIKSGDVFQILISNRYTQKGSVDRLSFYRLLRTKNPSPYLFLLEFEDFSICGSSPEVMIKLDNNDILLRPIAGTRKRGKDRKRDYELELEMLNDPKECAEHLMLIDLGRNDVGRVAKTGTVKVTEMMRVERYSHVMHMVSDIEAELGEGKDMFDLFKATFTAGTMTGAPKIKAMELIAKFEGLKRGFYSGCVGYFAFNGNMDSAIAIRTALIQNDKVTLQAGAGVVADSVPELEFLEVNNKLGALKATLEELQNLQ